MSITQTALMQQRRDTAANWTSANPTLLAGEIGIESDTNKIKLGTGSTSWTSLGYTPWSQVSAYPLVNADIAAAAAIVDTKLATIATAGKVSNSATTATNANTASAIVARDASGNFTAGTITAALTGAASSNVLKAGDTMTGALVVPLASAATPSLTFTGDLNTGIYSPGADQVAVATNGVERVEFGTAEVVFNDGGTDYDFRVEGDTSSHLLFVDASTDRVGIGTSSPSKIVNAKSASQYQGFLLSNASNSVVEVVGFSATNDNGAVLLRNGGTANVQLLASGASYFNGGNVGIGTTAPTGNLSFGATDAIINSDTSDASDNKSVSLAGGGTASTARGGYIQLYGNEYTTTGGVVDINSGNVANSYVRIQGRSSSSDIRFWINASEAGRFDSSGRLLVGTSSTVTNGQGEARLQVTTSSSYYIADFGHFSNDAFTGAVYFKKTRSTTAGGMASVVAGDYLGDIRFAGADGTNYIRAAHIECRVDGTPGTNDMPGRLVFSTTADGASSPTERMRIDSAGNILWGSPSNKAGIDAGTTDGKYVSSTGAVLVSSRSSTSTVNHNTFINGNGLVGTIQTNGSATSYNTSSDYRLKENVTAVTDGITRLQQLKPSRFNFIADPAKTVDGFIAHEVQDVVPEAIHGTKDEVDADGNPVYQGIDQSKLVPLLTAALQEAVAKIETLEAKVAALESA